MCGTGFSLCLVLRKHRLKSVPLKRLPSGEAGFDVMPPFDLVAFVGFPAKQHYPAITHRGEIDQTLLIILQLNAEALQLACECRKLYEQARVTWPILKTTAAAFSALSSLSGGSLKTSQTTMGLLNRSNNRPHAGQQGIRLFHGEKLHIDL